MSMARIRSSGWVNPKLLVDKREPVGQDPLEAVMMRYGDGSRPLVGMSRTTRTYRYVVLPSKLLPVPCRSLNTDRTNGANLFFVSMIMIFF